jgi:transcriptional regulator with XRE-family HTH domain
MNFSGDALRRIRTEAGLTIAELAERSGVTKSSILRLEAGSGRQPKASTITRLARALDVSVERLFDVNRTP